MELGISTFVETTPDPATGHIISHDQRIREVIEEIVLADQLGLDVYGVGEHHRADFAASAPAVILAAAAARTNRIRLTSAVTVLSSADPVRVFQDFATLDAISHGRAEIMAGRGSFIESFPLFGQNLNDYDELFTEKLDLLLHLRSAERITWEGTFRPSIRDSYIAPRPIQANLPIWIASGGNPESAMRAGALGLPLVLAIIGGSIEQFQPIVQLYKQAAIMAGHASETLSLATHSHGFVWDTTDEAADLFYPSTHYVLNKIGRERGWGPYNRRAYDMARSMDGALYVGDSESVAAKIVRLHKQLGITRFFLHVPVGSMPHDQVLRAIELYATKVAPLVRAALQNNKPT